jgi:acyl-CoA reductase-like NAD-dependent aldehyde dehydrogenase
VVVKPTEKAPLIALKLAEILEEAGFPPGTVSVVPASAEVTDILLTSPKVRKISFTGSVPVGKYIRDRVGLKKITLELGSNSANIIFPSADLDRAVDATVFGAFAHAGQSCISVQRIYLHKEIEQAFLDRFVPKVEALKLGDPLAEETDVGPMIDEPAAQKVESWIIEAREAGANLVTGGRREANMLWPTVLTRTTPEMKVVCEEVFAPLVAVASFSTVDEAIEQVNLSKYGLNAAVFTRDLGEVLRCIDELEVGQVIVNDASNFRADHMPYGGVKESGLGREGIRYAIEEMTEIKLAVIRP